METVKLLEEYTSIPFWNYNNFLLEYKSINHHKLLNCNLSKLKLFVL